MTEREAEEEARAAAAAMTALGLEPDGQLCRFCNSDSHVRPDCPTLRFQKEHAAKEREREKQYERMMFGGARRKR